jgi:hypothetical protein
MRAVYREIVGPSQPPHADWRRTKADGGGSVDFSIRSPPAHFPLHHTALEPEPDRSPSLFPTPALDDNSILHLLRDHDLALSRCAQSVHHDIVGEHVELLLVLALDVGVAGETDEVDESRFADIRGDVFGGDLGCQHGFNGTG